VTRGERQLAAALIEAFPDQPSAISQAELAKVTTRFGLAS
jgi:hypothetical protein